jgi:hypothetical protein
MTMTHPTTRRLVLALVLGSLTACRNPTAPEPELAVCSVRNPLGWLCIRPCPPLTEAWAASVPLQFTATDQCATVSP